MHKIAIGIIYSQPDSAFYFAQMGYDLAESVNNKKKMGNALITQGVSFANRGDYAKAIDYYTRSLKIQEEIGDKKGIAYSLSNIGIIYYHQGDYAKAIDYYTKCLKISEELGDKKGIAATLINIGNIYKNQGNYAKAMDYYTRNLKINEELGDENGITASLNNIGIIYYHQGDYAKAMDYYTRSIKIYEELGDKKGIAATLINIGIIYNDQGDYAKAIDYYTKCLKIREEIGDKNGIANSLNSIGNIYKNQGDYGKALEIYTKSLSIAKEIGNVIRIRYASQNLWEVHKKLGKHKQALEMHELYIEMRDSLNNMENKEAAIKLQYQHQNEKEQAVAEAKHQEAMALSAEREKRQKLIAWSAGGGLVMVLLFAFFIFNRLQVTRKQKKVIEDQAEDITDSIRYARNIQQALLPTIDNLNEALPDGFVLLQPKDIVSGDFYWLQQYNNQVYFAVCDCTGHGVPGAFMSMIGSSLLDEAVVEKGITKPSEIFFEVRKGFINALKQSGEADQQKDGMDAVLCSWNKNGNLEYALAYNPLLLIREGEILETKADMQPVGYHTEEQKPFTHHELKLEKGDTVYIFSDGYPDQFGGKRNKKFMMKNFKKLLVSIQDKTMREQKAILETTMKEWKGDNEQVDDILVMGVRF